MDMWQRSRRLRRRNDRSRRGQMMLSRRRWSWVVPLCGIGGRKLLCLCLYYSISWVKKTVCQTVAVPSTYLSFFPLLFHTCHVYMITRWWFQIFFISTPIWGSFPFWLLFFRWVETTNQIISSQIWVNFSRMFLSTRHRFFAFEARAAFQKTASDMEHERINLMSVITQVTPPVLWEHDMNRMMWLTHTHKPNDDDPKVTLVQSNYFPKRLEDFFSEICELGTVWMSYYLGAGEPELRAFVPWDGSTFRSCNQNSTGSGFGRERWRSSFKMEL